MRRRKRLQRRTRLRVKGGHRFPQHVNEPLREFVRLQPCLLRGHPEHERCGLSECAHIKTRGSGGEDDNNVVPLCRWAHLEQEGRTKRFERRYNIDLRAHARDLTARFYAAA